MSPKKNSVKRTKTRSTTKSTTKLGKNNTNKHHKISKMRSPSIPFELYQKSGNCIRPFIVLPIPNNTIWFTPRIAFFRSSGRSNAGSEILAGTWFPTVGIQPFDGEFPIIKMVMLHKSNILSIEISDMLSQFVDFLSTIENIETIIQKTKEINQTAGSNNPYEAKGRFYMMNQISACVLKISLYFHTIWQMRMSMNLGDGMWSSDHDEHDERFILTLFRRFFIQFYCEDRNTIGHNRPLNVIRALEQTTCSNDAESGIGPEETKINAFLETEMAYIDIYSPEVRHIDSFCKPYLDINRKVNLLFNQYGIRMNMMQRNETITS